MSKKKAIIIGAGPAGLTAAYEMLKNTDIIPVIFEQTGDIGGISKTVEHKGNRIDIGGHRFFSKSERVMKWWQTIMPLQGAPSKDDLALGRDVPLSENKGAPDPEKTDSVMLVRGRLSRIFFLRKFFDYPVSLNLTTIANLGLVRIMRVGFSYIKTRLFPIRNERSLEDFFINRFGRELYETFFKDYTEKVWGVPCDRISAEWGAQRIKGLSITKTIIHAFRQLFVKETSIDQKEMETSLIEQFMYPKLGPGQLWEKVAAEIEKMGVELYLNHRATAITSVNGRVKAITVTDQNGQQKEIKGDFFLSSMPVSELIEAFGERSPANVREVASGLMYRDFITVGLLLKKLRIRNTTSNRTVNNIVPDNWIYIQERDVKVGRLQIFNNWSPYMVKDNGNVWIGLEYFCNEGDDLWTMPEKDFAAFATNELEKIDIISKDDVIDSVVIKVPKTYPAYFGSHGRFNEIRSFTDTFENLFLIGRNGMHRYNNMDHSMLTAMTAVDNIGKGILSKDNIWEINTEEEYHEGK